MEATDTTPNAAVYLRQSLDRSGDELAVSRQREDALKLAALRGWTVVAEHVDNDASASGGKARPGFEALLRSIEDGTVTVVIAWNLDRLTRNRKDTLRLIDTGQKHRTVIALVRGSDLDLSTVPGRMTADILASVARAEIEAKSERQARAAEQRAKDGRPPVAPRLFGFTAKGATIEHEAAVVRTVFDMFTTEGKTIYAIRDHLRSTGVPTRYGKPWAHSAVRNMLMNPRYAGRAVRNGQEIGVTGTWEALVSDDTFELAGAILGDPGRRTHSGNSRKHLGTGLFTCAKCDSLVRVGSAGRYQCAQRCWTRAGQVIDAHVLSVIRGVLSRKDWRVEPQRADDPAGEIVAELTKERAWLAKVKASFNAGQLDPADFADAKRAAATRIAKAEAKLSAMRSRGGAAVVLDAADPVQAFNQADVTVQRMVIEELAVVRISPAPAGRAGWGYGARGVEVTPR